MPYVSKAHWQAIITRIETKGWQQDSSGGPGGPNCIMGALKLEILDFTTRSNMLWELRKIIGKSITVWNDALGRSKAEVLSVLVKLRDGAE